VSEALKKGFDDKIQNSQLITLVNRDATHCVSCLVLATGKEIEEQEQGISCKDNSGYINSVHLDDVKKTNT
jgi:hypothetical protein